MSRHELYGVVRSHESPLADCLTAANELSVLLARARRLVDKGPGCEPAIFGQILLGQHLLSPQVGWEGEDASPFVTVRILLGEYLAGRSQDEVEIGRVAVRKGG